MKIEIEVDSIRITTPEEKKQIKASYQGVQKEITRNKSCSH
jgi:hypothetical protein